ncbi:MAG: hypothetical protein HZA13_03525 [Nitrospirae bacterium]|nr:hypothetical protein [Nitrospirota bacterium]
MKRIIILASWIAVHCLIGVIDGNAFEFNGFADASFTKCTNDDCGAIGEEGGRNGNFTVGTLDLYVAHNMDKIDALVELVIEGGSIVDLERMILRYSFSDALQINMGRFHTPMGFWNTSFHHGVQLQTTINRPEFLLFEDDGGILPVHTVGLYLSGRTRRDPLIAEYGVMVGNGPRVTSEDEESNLISPNNVTDNTMGKSVAFNVTLSSPLVEGLKLGAQGHIARIESDSSFVPVNGISAVDVDQTIIGASIIYSTGNIDLMGEYFSIKDKDNIGSAGSNTSNAYYGLISYTIADRWIPYLLHENMSVKSDKDPYFIALGSTDVRKTTLGLRYNLSYRSSLKAEWRDVDRADGKWNEYGFQWAIAF